MPDTIAQHVVLLVDDRHGGHAALAEQLRHLRQRGLRSDPRDRVRHDLTDRALHADHLPTLAGGPGSGWIRWASASTATRRGTPRARPAAAARQSGGPADARAATA